jgi:hypothetical protein
VSAAKISRSRSWATGRIAWRRTREHRDRDLQGRDAQRRRNRGRSAAERQHADQERADRQILDQQHREGRAPEAGGEIAALGQHLQDDRGRGQRQPGPDHHRRRPAQTGQERGQGDRHRGHDDLRRAEPEGPPAHQPDALEGQLEADGEQQEHDPQLGQGAGPLQIADQAQAGRPDHRAGDQIAEHRAELQALEQEHRDHRRREDDDDLDQVSGFGHGLAWPGEIPKILSNDP